MGVAKEKRWEWRRRGGSGEGGEVEVVKEKRWEW